MTTKEDHGKDQAIAQLESIKEIMERFEVARDGDTDDLEDIETEIQEEIQEGPLSVLVRSDWHEVGAQASHIEYEILLCSGGPAVRIRGTLDQDLDDADTARIDYQDWDIPWTELKEAREFKDVLIDYANQFYYGE